MTEKRRQRSVARYFSWGGGALAVLILLLGGIALLFLDNTRAQTRMMVESYGPRAVGAQRLAVDASHLAALCAELANVAGDAERQTLLQRMAGLKLALDADIDMLHAAELNQIDLAAVVGAEQALLEGVDAIATLPESDQQRRLNLVRRQSEIVGRFLFLASSQSDDAALLIEQEQKKVIDWATRIEGILGLTLLAGLALLAGLRAIFRRRVVERVRSLETAMVNWRENGAWQSARPPSAATPDPDEIDAMAAALGDLLGEINSRTAQLEQLIVTDPLTGVGNRRLLVRRLEEEASRAQRYHHHLTVIFFDLDHFKNVNDRYGHAVGDIVLIRVVECLRSTLRECDLLGRVGGDEFVAVLIETGIEDAVLLVERMRLALAGLVLSEMNERITISAGLAELLPGESADDLLLRADEALYGAKAAGRDCLKIGSRP